jgi:hypothetical protein
MLDIRSLIGILWLNVDVGVGTRFFGPWIFHGFFFFFFLNNVVNFVNFLPFPLW